MCSVCSKAMSGLPLQVMEGLLHLTDRRRVPPPRLRRQPRITLIIRLTLSICFNRTDCLLASRSSFIASKV